MNVRKIVWLVFVLLLFVVFKPSSSYAVDFKEMFTSGDSMIVRIVEGVEYIFTFTAEKKVEVLEKHAERKLETAKQYAQKGQEEKVQSMMLRYEKIKERLGKIVEKNIDGDVLGSVEERLINQQTTIEEIKGMVGTSVKNEIVQVQEKVVNDTAKWVVEVNGPEGQTEFFQKVEHVWAPGTGPGGEAGVVVEGGEMKFAPGTEQGGPSEQDIQNVVIESSEGNEGGGGNEVENIVVD